MSILAELLEALPNPALIVSGGRVRISNKAAKAVLGSGIDGQDVRLAIRHPEALERLQRRPVEAAEEIELVGLGEAERRWTMSIAPLQAGGTFLRLTDRSEAYAAERMRVDFVANASHELRTPLASVIGYAETLRDDIEGLEAAARDRFLGIVHSEAQRMQRIVEDLISLSRIEAERFSPPRDALDLRPLVECARENCAVVAGERGCEVRIKEENGLPPILGDRGQVLQLLDNLLSNALRYGRTGGIVTVALARAGKGVRLSVSDEGDGIAPEHIPRVTERFYRVDPGRSRGLGGTGLGLSIVKHIVERHRGTLDIQSKVGVGTTVTVTLPAAREGTQPQSDPSPSA